MEVIHSLFDLNPSQKTIITIGTFDGVHIGHQKIIEKLVSEAKASNKKSVLLTFFPHPRMVLQKDVSIKLINTITEKAQHLEKLGLDYLIIHPFSKEFSRLTALDFVRDILVNQLNISKLIIGYDHHFGKNREGNIEQLTEYSHLYDFTVQEIPAQDIDDVSVSSTKIRKALANGHLKTANNYLGYNFSLTGKVVNGKQLGGKIGFPTANIDIPEDYKLIPKTGVYIIKSIIENTTIYGMMNIGNRPTVDGEHQTIEVHYFNFNQNLYCKELTIELLYYLRNEQKFDSVSCLISQLKKDKQNSLLFLKSYVKP
ncbi:MULTISPECIES: bifunctional riboflavin kinase/FAD synthetase [Tenacibaculum]|uniref:Riboflavin biosynthesis protein n=1 Tax=Tenacibaculum mesophilum TaxID=104268 RepID=A0AAE9MP65_9FLAO|nr:MULTISPECIES: bifunctional riboflavin kinase/FAD synthetase [Tenacibaculum]AZJ32911.1 bifunctional riboflavin kinase/FAD synthetase [Tenacibaculum mesophilum]KAF9659098.1 bifunctional riboflavin kinase/FAD synthetase [Tenacibaculum mesophilum]MCG7500890.1 bifunctional riboflavin kinase/FAD synthetase [Tenacibaculum sp. Mcav3-52]MCO7184070.1 bifunctional riboflavin kinase/FAD synthetase [Tenacibaculum sp. XPcli2-G]QFS28160.1 bifunctional riboflavin kinase/FAD synthetase [Tenacibaculum mesoph